MLLPPMLGLYYGGLSGCENSVCSRPDWRRNRGRPFRDGVGAGAAHHAPLYRDVVAVVPVVDVLVADQLKEQWSMMMLPWRISRALISEPDKPDSIPPNSESTDQCRGVGNVQSYQL